MKIIKKFSKSSKDIKIIKANFYGENKKMLNKVLNINQLYSKEPKRTNCKNCYKKLKNSEDFISFKVKYYICRKCGHLNGGNVETDKFLNHLYTRKSGLDYSRNYTTEFNRRVKNIYSPKVNFLKKILKKKIKLLDVGCGSGYFLKACENNNIQAKGIDVNKIMIDLANKNLKKNKAFFKESFDFKNILDSRKYNTVSLIGVLEHLKDPNSFLKSFKNSKIKYLYLSLPLFSLNCFIENTNPEVFPRHLGGAHTHLYTKNSISFFLKKFKFNILAEWWFGNDAQDWLRTLSLKAEKKCQDMQ